MRTKVMKIKKLNFKDAICHFFRNDLLLVGGTHELSHEAHIGRHCNGIERTYNVVIVIHNLIISRQFFGIL